MNRPLLDLPASPQVKILQFPNVSRNSIRSEPCFSKCPVRFTHVVPSIRSEHLTSRLSRNRSLQHCTSVVCSRDGSESGNLDPGVLTLFVAQNLDHLNVIGDLYLSMDLELSKKSYP